MCWDATYILYPIVWNRISRRRSNCSGSIVNFLLFQLLSWFVLLLLRVFAYSIYIFSSKTFHDGISMVKECTFKDIGSKLKWNYNALISSGILNSMVRWKSLIRQNFRVKIRTRTFFVRVYKCLGNLICHVSCQNSHIFFFIWIRISVNLQSISVYYYNLKRNKKKNKENSHQILIKLKNNQRFTRYFDSPLII